MNKLTHKIKSIQRKYLPSAKDKQEMEELLYKRTDFYKQLVSQGDICFDVGANVGNRIQPLLNIGAKVVAIEPQQKCIEILKKTFGERITLVTEGLGEQEGVKTFYISDSSTISSFSEDWIEAVKDNRFKGHKWNKTESIKMTTLDALIKKYGQPVFIKIDVEGYELEVLKGLSSPVKYISFEYTVPEQTSKAIDCIEQIQKTGDTIFNYSIGESMEFALPQWLNIEQMIEHVNSDEFISTNFGDIYAYKK